MKIVRFSVEYIFGLGLEIPVDCNKDVGMQFSGCDFAFHLS